MLLFPISRRAVTSCGVSMCYRLIFILFDGFPASSAHGVHAEGCRTSDICKKKEGNTGVERIGRGSFSLRF